MKVTTARPKVKLRLHHDVSHLCPKPMSLPSKSQHDVAHVQTPTNNPTKFQLPTAYSFQDFKGQGHYSKFRGKNQG